MTDISN